MKFPISRFSVRDKSMEPMFHEKENVITVNWAQIIKGSVVVFSLPNSHPERSEGSIPFVLRLLRHFAPRNDARIYLIKRVKKIDGENIIVAADNKKLAKKVWTLKRDQIVGRVFLKY